MANFLYVDNSNIWIEGMHVSAVAKGMAPDIWGAQQQRICDTSWSYDFGKLLTFAGGDRKEVGRAVLFGSRPPANDTLWAMARKVGFEVHVFDRNAQNKEKKVDTSIAVSMTEDSFQRMKKGDEVTLVAGDRDHVPAVERLVERGFKVYVVFWEHAARELREACTQFTSLNGYLEHLRRD
jgi:uncharacterized LabA/DUF88 family protein